MLAGGPSESAPDPGAASGRDHVTLLTLMLLLVITVAAWAHVLSSPMSDDHLAGMSMAMTPTLVGGLAYVAAWAVMMAAMMLPSALPMIGLFAATQRNAAGPADRAALVALFTSMYLGLWAVTGVPIYLVSVALTTITAEALAYGVAGGLVVAGIFQLSPLKQVGLRHCRSPLRFLLGHWRAGWRGGLAMGWAHARYCLGCCWALMVVLVVAGAVGVPWGLLVAGGGAGGEPPPGGGRVRGGGGGGRRGPGRAVALSPGVRLPP